MKMSRPLPASPQGMSSDAQPSISVVIPNYNGKHLLESNLPSIYSALKYARLNFEIIIVDDASSDDSIVFVKQNYPDITLLINEANKGFSPTINKGIFLAKNDLVLALNSDVELTPDYFIEQLKYFESPDTFGVMGHIIDHNSSEIQDSGKFPSFSFKGIKTTYNYIPLAEKPNTWLPSFFLSGANALVDRNKLMQLNGFDEIYAPYYYEDADLGIRAWRAGWCCYIEPRSVCMHATSSTIGKVKPEKVKIIAERNRIIINHLHLPNTQLLFFKCWLWIRCIFKLFKGNSIIYKAIQLYRKSHNAIEQSRQSLQTLQTKTNVNYSVYDIEQKILKIINSIPYRIF